MSPRRTGIRALLALGSLLAALLLVELVTRIYFPVHTWKRSEIYLLESGERRRILHGDLKEPGGTFLPDLRFEICYDPHWKRSRLDERGCIEMSTNADGLRGPVVPRKRAPGTFRFVALGDSYTFGHGVPFEETWPELLRAGLQRCFDRGSTRVRVEAVNLGVSGLEIGGIDRIMLPRAIGYHPDLILYCLFLNDVEGRSRAYNVAKTALNHETFDEPQGLTALSCLWRHVSRAIALRRFLATSSYESFLQPDSRQSRGYLEHLRAMREALLRARIEFRVALFPELQGLDGIYPFEAVHARLRAGLEELGIPYIDLLNTFRGHDPADLWVHLTDSHANGRAQGLAAGTLERWLEPDLP